jgi:hypothetical protein
VDSKNLLQSLFRGWLPMDQSFQNGACEGEKPQVNQNAKLGKYEDRPLMKRWMKASVTLGGVGYLVFYFLTPSFQSTNLGFSLWATVMALLVFLDYLSIKDFMKEPKSSGGFVG